MIALQQAARHCLDGERNLDLPLTGTALPQLEWDMLDLVEASMELDDPLAMAALLATARELLQSRVEPEVSGETQHHTTMIADAILLVARGLEQPGTTWPALAQALATVAGLRPLVARRLAVTNPGYVAEVADAPP